MKNRKSFLFYTLITIVSTLVFIAGCKKKVIDVPTVVTSEATITSATTASCGGRVTDDGGTEMTARGVCWTQGHLTPDIGSSRTFDGAQTGSFTSKIENLSPSTTYNVRAYATNMKGVSYGETVTFTTGP
jgi:hypothetical protein